MKIEITNKEKINKILELREKIKSKPLEIPKFSFSKDETDDVLLDIKFSEEEIKNED